MKKLFSMLLSAAVLLCSFAGCSSDKPGAVLGVENGTSVPNRTEGTKLRVYTSFYPMYDFAKKVGGDKIELANMVPAGSEPHDWEPSTTDIANLERADMFIYNGAGMEHWVEDVLASLSNKALMIVEASKGVALIDRHASEHADGNPMDEDGHTHDHPHEEEHDHGRFDPHVWISIKNAQIQMENIKNALISVDPDNAAYYENNYRLYAEKFEALDQKFASTLSPLPKKDIVVAHQAFGYLCRDYGLRQVAIEGLSPDSEPDPARMAEIVRFSRDNQITIIFFEDLVSPKVAESIANELGIKTDILSPVEGLTDEQLANGEDYLTVMDRNLSALQAALS